MIDTAKFLLRPIKDWPTSSNQLYQLAGCVAGLLTIAAYIGDERPSEIMAGVMRCLKVNGVARWFESGLPSALTQPDIHANRAFVIVAGFTVLILILKPFFDAKRYDWSIDLQAQGILDARAACTTWILLLFAAQYGSLKWASAWLHTQVDIAAIIIVGIAVIGGLLFLTAYGLALHGLISVVGGWVMRGLMSVSVVVIMAMIALCRVVIKPVHVVASWLFATESDACVDLKWRISERRASRELATGAISLPVKAEEQQYHEYSGAG